MSQPMPQDDLGLWEKQKRFGTFGYDFCSTVWLDGIFQHISVQFIKYVIVLAYVSLSI